MRIYIQVNNASHQRLHATALRDGFKKHGIDCEFGPRGSAPASKCDIAAVWGYKPPQLMKSIKDSGVGLLICERGYLPDRMVFTSLGFGGLNNRAKFPACADNGERFNRLWPGLIKPWRTGGEYVLICGQVPGDAALYNVNFDDWAQKVSYQLREKQEQVVFRPHPFLVRNGRPWKSPIGAKQSKVNTLQQDLAGAKLCVTYNSNSGVESVLFGVPTVTMDEGAMAWDVTSHSIEEEPVRPEREAWAHRLSWCNWTLAEIASGEAWEQLRTVYPC